MEQSLLPQLTGVDTEAQRGEGTETTQLVESEFCILSHVPSIWTSDETVYKCTPALGLPPPPQQSRALRTTAHGFGQASSCGGLPGHCEDGALTAPFTGGEPGPVEGECWLKFAGW